MAKKQSTLPTSWSTSTSRTSPKKARLTDEASNAMCVPQSDDDQDSEDSSLYADSSTVDTTTQQDETSVIENQNESLPGPSRSLYSTMLLYPLTRRR